MRTSLFVALIIICAYVYTCLPVDGHIQYSKHNRHIDKVYRELWKEWKYKHNMHYSGEINEARYYIFKQNVITIDKHNNGPNIKYQMATNQFSHMTFEEFRQKMAAGPALGRKILTDTNLFESIDNPNDFNATGIDLSLDAPKSMDWRTTGCVTAVKNQEQCGSCYSFSAVESIESLNCINNGNLYVLSEQQVVDCSSAYGNNGCDGGLMENVFKYTAGTGGLCLEKDYPYMAKQGTCQTSCNKVVQISNFTLLPQNETLLQQVVGKLSPVSIAIDVNDAFQHYSSGVFDGDCPGQELNHGVSLVGYGTDPNGEDYWIVRNSWSEQWGESGYIRMVRGRNQCGIANEASYPIQ
jgi:C1A family cysteine protease